MNELAVMSGMSGASMLRTRRKDVNVKPNRKLDRKSSRGMLYENEELRLRTININAEVERGQSDIKKLKRENDQLKREISALRYEYDKLDHLLRERRSSPEQSDVRVYCVLMYFSIVWHWRRLLENTVGAHVHLLPHVPYLSATHQYPSWVLGPPGTHEIGALANNYEMDSGGCEACAECAGAAGRGHVAFNELSVVPEEDAAEYSKEQRECGATECIGDHCCPCTLAPEQSLAHSQPFRKNGISNGEGSALPELSFTGRNATAEAATSQYRCEVAAPAFVFHPVNETSGEPSITQLFPPSDILFVPKSLTPEPCNCGTCANSRPTIDATGGPSTSDQNAGSPQTTAAQESLERPVDVLVHNAPSEPVFFQSVTSDPYHVAAPPPPGFVLSAPRFHTGGNVEDLLGEVQTAPTIQTTFIENSVFMCNTRKITQKHEPCCCKGHTSKIQQPEPEAPAPKSYVTEKNIELNYDYPKTSSVDNQNSESSEMQTTTTEVASTVVFVERRIPVRPKKFDFLFRSRSAPVGDSEEPIYATVKKLPKRLKRMDLANLEREVAYQAGEPDSSIKTELTVKTDSEQSQVPHPDDDTSRSEKEKSPQRQDTTKAKKRRRFSLTFKKRERKRKEPKNGTGKNGTTKNGLVSMDGDGDRLIEESEVQEFGKQKACRHRARNTMSSCSSGPRYKRDSYQKRVSKPRRAGREKNMAYSNICLLPLWSDPAAGPHRDDVTFRARKNKRQLVHEFHGQCVYASLQDVSTAAGLDTMVRMLGRRLPVTVEETLSLCDKCARTDMRGRTLEKRTSNNYLHILISSKRRNFDWKNEGDAFGLPAA
ncbi:hypothetical protein EVAR_24063_1 [Eumeta japonica]|uniref:Uncharacterized protein n=1 Tax=Eumeta variegata TaxID=151549 RepID=A0A4C1VSM9_EUMVA|nr:hypothetical protein EVAR_24063_1 [Eumeta japonica]